MNHLQKAGYQTAWIGKYHLGHNPKGFDFWEILPGQGHYYNPDFIQMDGKTIRKEGYVSDLIEDTAEKWISERDKDQPFCHYSRSQSNTSNLDAGHSRFKKI